MLDDRLKKKAETDAIRPMQKEFPMDSEAAFSQLMALNKTNPNQRQQDFPVFGGSDYV